MRLLTGMAAIGLGLALAAPALQPADAASLSFAWQTESTVTPAQYQRYRGQDDGYVSPQAGVRCGQHGCWENDRYGRPTGRVQYYNQGRRGRGYVSPQAGTRCGAHGCWENDRYGRPTGRAYYFD